MGRQRAAEVDPQRSLKVAEVSTKGTCPSGQQCALKAAVYVDDFRVESGRSAHSTQALDGLIIRGCNVVMCEKH